MNATQVTLRIMGREHVPSFKNSKMILWKQKRIMTKPEIQHWMEAVIQSFESQLRSALATSGIATTTGRIQPSQIALLLPLDDSRKWIPEHCVKTQLVSKGEEGAEIIIERIDASQLLLDESKPQDKTK